MQILIIGGTKFYGKLLVKKLLARGHHVTIYSRGNIIPEKFVKANVTFIKGDRTDHNQFHLALKKRKYDVVYDNCVMNAKDVEGSIRTFSDHIDHYILCSSVIVYNDWDRKKAYKESEINYRANMTVDLKMTKAVQWLVNYANGKREAEKLLVSNKKNFSFTILRPAVIQGENDPYFRMQYFLEHILKERPILIPTEPYIPILQHIYVQDIADFAVKVIEKNRPTQNVYNIASEESIDMISFLKRLAQVCHKDIKLVKTNQSKIIHDIENFPIFFDRRLTVDITKAKETFNFKPLPINAWLSKVAKWYLNEQTAKIVGT